MGKTMTTLDKVTVTMDDDGFIECSNGDTYVYTGSRLFGPGRDDLVGVRCANEESAFKTVISKYGGVLSYEEHYEGRYYNTNEER